MANPIVGAFAALIADGVGGVENATVAHEHRAHPPNIWPAALLEAPPLLSRTDEHFKLQAQQCELRTRVREYTHVGLWTAMDCVRAAGSVILWIWK